MARFGKKQRSAAKGGRQRRMVDDTARGIGAGSLPSARLQALLLEALEHAAAIAAEASRKPAERPGEPNLSPFLWLEAGAERHTRVYPWHEPAQALAAARTAAAKLAGATQAVLVHDGVLSVGGERSDALIVHAHERGAPETWVFGWRYRPAKGRTRFATQGNATLLRREDPLFLEPTRRHRSSRRRA